MTNPAMLVRTCFVYLSFAHKLDRNPDTVRIGLMYKKERAT
jgi:hypothetical protein